jgi:hypothetical protein
VPPSSFKFDIDAIREQIADAQPLGEARWLAESHGAPDRFFEALCTYNSRLFVPQAKSSPAVGFDLYHDAISRHASSTTAERVAWRGFHRERGQISLSYGELHERASRLSAVLRERGAKPGQPIGILLHFDMGALIALAAVLRVGGIACLVPPLGERYVARRLNAVKPALVISERVFQRLCAPHKPVLLSESGRAPADTDSHTYAPKAPALMLLSPLRDPPWLPVPVPGSLAYLRALCDAMCIYGLRPSDGLCAPGFDPVQHQPALWLAALLVGATFVDLEPAELERDPSLLPKLGVTCLGINVATRDILRKAPSLSLPRLLSWFRSPLEPFDAEAWRDLLPRHGLGGVPALSVYSDATQGGALLFSSRSKNKHAVLSLVLPAPGVSHKVLAVDLSGQGAPRKSWPVPSGR